MENDVYSLEQLRVIEQHAIHQKINLMTRAALACADWVSARYPIGSSIWVAAGVGNNGGDALMAAEILAQRGFTIQVIALRQPNDAQHINRIKVASIEIWRRLDDLKGIPDLIIDGLLGIGLEHAPDEALSLLIQRLNHTDAPILSLDVPSGLNAFTGVVLGSVIRSKWTLTFLSHKAGLFMGDGADLSGEVFLADLDFEHGLLPQGSLNLGFAQAITQLHRPRNSHKGHFGSVAIVGGNIGMVGAALLAGRAAFSVGVGKVWLHVLDNRLVVDTFTPELMLRDALDDLSEANALAVGMGLGQDGVAAQTLKHALAFDCPMVLDADALNLLAQKRCFLPSHQSATVVTPHPAEAARLLQKTTVEIQSNRIQAAQQLAVMLNSVVVLKGAGSVIAEPKGNYWINTSGSAALAVAGQGDVLSGMITGLLAQGLEAIEAARMGVYVHGLTGDLYTSQSAGTIGLRASESTILVSSILNQMVEQ